MVQKRPLDAEQIFEVSFKHPKHVGPSNQFVSFPKSVFLEDACQLPKNSEGGRRQVTIEGNENPDVDNFELPGGAGDSKTSIPGNIYVSSWATSNTIEDVQSESPGHVPIIPEYFSPDRPLRTLVRYEDIYSILLEHPPRKLVSVGANYQADIPSLDFSAASSRPEASDAHSDSNSMVRDEEVQKRLMGSCIIPMPQMESTYDNEKVGKGRTDCSCDDMGSVRCVRQHIVEAREELIKSLGHERFTELGFSDMGEQVAEKWSAREEHIFHEFVFNNPSSLDKNFWNNLSVVLPSRTKREIISYYFNVFMIQRRAEQNRNELWNIDSDNDEWQGGDDNEVATLGEDQDSIADSPVCHRNYLVNYDDYPAEEPSDVSGILDFTNRDIGVDSKYDQSEIPQSSGSLAPIQPQESCDEVKMENGDHWFGDPNGVSNGCSQRYITLGEALGDGRRQETR